MSCSLLINNCMSWLNKFIGEPADLPSCSLPTRRDVIRFVRFLRLNTTFSIRNNDVFDMVADRLLVVMSGRDFSPEHRNVKR